MCMNEEAVKSAADQKTGASRSTDGALRTLGELEQHFERIKKLHAATAEREAELEQISAQVQARTLEVEARAAALDRKVEEIEAGRSALESTKAQVEAARVDVNSARAALEREKQELEPRRRELAEHQERVKGIQAQLEAREQAAQAAAGKVESERAALAEEQRRLAGAKASLESDRVVVEKLLSESATRDESLGAREHAVSERERTVADAQKLVAQRSAELDRSCADAEKLRTEAERERVRMEADQREVAGMQQRLAMMMKAVQARAAELEAREKSLSERERALSAGNEQASHAEQAADEELRKLELLLAERAALIASRDAEIAELRAESERLGAESLKAREEAEAAGRQIAEAKAASVRPAVNPKASAETEKELEKSRKAIELLAEKLRTAQKEIEDLRGKLASASQRPAAAPTGKQGANAAHNALRRRRLQKYKGLLQTQARKIMSAQAALSKRQSEADQILAHRAKLAAAAELIKQREVRLNSQRSKSAGASLMLAFSLTTVALAGMSWLAATKIAPATFLASATLEAETKGRGGKSAEDLEGWQSYHNQLVNDPQLIEQAAERVARRGMSALGTGAALQAHLKDHLVADSPKDGQLVLNLRGEDAQATATLLDTFVTSMASTANMSRTQRPDGLVTEISRGAQVPQAPIAHQRFVYAGGIFGGSMLVAMCLGTAGWRRMSRSRRSADADEALGNFLSEQNWKPS